VFRARFPHPEFGYAATSNYPFFSALMVFVVCGLIAGAINFVIFNCEPDRDPMVAMALAPAEGLIAAKRVQLATEVESVRPLRAMNEQPLITMGQGDGLNVLPASPSTPAEEPKTAAAPTEISVREETSPDAASAAVTPPAAMPTVTSEKPQQRVHRASRRYNQYSYTSSYGARRYYASRTYSRLPGFW